MAKFKLTAKTIAAIKDPGRYADGNGLYLQVSKAGGKSWLMRYMLNGKSQEMGLGALLDVPLSEAREKAADARKLLADKRDPLVVRKQERQAAAKEVAKAVTFKAAAEAYIAAHKATWKNAKHGAQWTSTLETYVFPVFGHLPVAEVDTDQVLKALEPIWHEKTETASRVRGRIESVLDWARVRGYRDGPNPALWRGHLAHLLPSRSKVQQVKHHVALPYGDVAAFMADLRQRHATSARALEFTILTAARTGEVLGATWDEIDLEGTVWTVPAKRMKGRREHRVPLAPEAVAILKTMAEEHGKEGYLFPSARKSKPLSNMTFLMLMRRMGRGELTAHGFRSTFRDWVAEQTSFPGEVAEAALAHVVGDKVEAAYRRGDLFGKRRELMEAWADYCHNPAK